MEHSEHVDLIDKQVDDISCLDKGTYIVYNINNESYQVIFLCFRVLRTVNHGMKISEEGFEDLGGDFVGVLGEVQIEFINNDQGVGVADDRGLFSKVIKEHIDVLNILLKQVCNESNH